MTHGKPFELGRAKTGGRLKGSRNKISEAFPKDLAAEWEKAARFDWRLPKAQLLPMSDHQLDSTFGLPEVCQDS